MPQAPDHSIKAGDLVVSIKGCPKCSSCLGKIFVVLRLQHAHFFQCHDCRYLFIDAKYTAAIHGEVAGLPLSWLKKIPPLEELEREKRKEETHA